MAKAPEKSIWEELAPPAPFNSDLLVKTFPSAQPLIKKAAGPEEGRKRLRVLDDKSSQNLGIAFSRLPGPEALGAILRSLDGFPECLPPEAVRALHVAMTEQEAAVKKLTAVS